MRINLENVSNAEMGDIPRYTGVNFERVATAINGRIEFGPNIPATITQVIFTAANTVTTVPHGLLVVPQGYIIIKQNAAGSIVTSELTNPWTTTNIYLSASAAMTATLIII